MPRPSKEQLENFWNFADKNNDGKLDIKEFKRAVVEYRTGGGQAKCAPPSDREIANMFQSMNDNNDKYLSKAEFLDHVNREAANCENLKKAFKAFDKNGDGVVSRQELTDLMLANGYKECDVKTVLDKADKDGDGNIDFSEFMDCM